MATSRSLSPVLSPQPSLPTTSRSLKGQERGAEKGFPALPYGSSAPLPIASLLLSTFLQVAEQGFLRQPRLGPNRVRDLTRAPAAASAAPCGVCAECGPLPTHPAQGSL